MSRKFIFSLLPILILMWNCSGSGALSDEVSMQRYYNRYQEGKTDNVDRLLATYMDPGSSKELKLTALKYLIRSKDVAGRQLVISLLKRPTQISAEELTAILSAIYSDPDPLWSEELMGSYAALMKDHLSHQNHILQILTESMTKDQLRTYLQLYEKSQEAYLQLDLRLSETLGKFDDDAVVPLLISIVNNPKADIRQREAALKMLGNKKDPEIGRMLTKMLGDPESDLMVRDFSLNILESGADEKIMLALLEFLQDNKEREYKMMQTVIDLLKEYNDPDIIPSLHYIFENQTFREDLRQQAFESLLAFKDDKVLTRLIKSINEMGDYSYWPDLSEAVSASSNMELRQQMEILALQNQLEMMGGDK